MAPLPPIADIWQVTTFGVLGGMPCDHVINYNFPLGAQDVLQVSKDFADADALAMTNHIIPLLQPAYQHLSSRCIYLGSATAPEVDAPRAAGPCAIPPASGARAR